MAAGPALVLSYILVALACGFAALCYAEMASMVPVAGSAYTYAYVTLGEFLAWIIGWDLILEYAVGNVAVAVSWADYFKSLLAGLGLHLPDWLSTTLDHARQTPGSARRRRRTCSASPSSSTCRPASSWRCSPCCWCSVSTRAPG